jgi:hypothetical protein
VDTATKYRDRTCVKADIALAARAEFERVIRNPALFFISPDECWRWTGRLNRKGYGVIAVEKRFFKVHRLSFEKFKGKLAPGDLVMHTCDQRSCFNPRHLQAGSPADNTQDMISKGRANFQK